MVLNLRCRDYGFECDFTINEVITREVVQKLRNHFDEEHGIDYSIEAVLQMLSNRGHSLESIK